MAASDLAWQPFQGTYVELNKAAALSRPVPDGTFKSNLPALQAGLPFFKPPNPETRKTVDEKPSVSTSHGKLPIIAAYRAATGELSQLLRLDAVQTHLLLRRALGSSPPDSSSCQLSSDQTQQVVDLYFAERIHLLKCQQLVLRLEALSSPALSPLLHQLIKGGVEHSLFLALSDNLAAWGAPSSSTDSSPGAAAGASSSNALVVAAAGAAIADGTSCLPWNTGAAPQGQRAVHVPSTFQRQVQLQILRERAELLQILVQLYHTPLTALPGASSSGGSGPGSPHHAPSSRSSGVALTLAVCSGERMQQLVTKMGAAMFRGPVQNWGGNSEAAALWQLTEVLGAALVITALRPLLSLQATASYAAKAAAGAAEPHEAPKPHMAGRLRAINAELGSWQRRGSTAAAQLAFSGWLRLYDVPEADGHQGSAFKGGGFAAIAALLQLEELEPGSAEGQLLRDVLLQGLGLVAYAYEFSPFQLPEATVKDLLQLLAVLLEDQEPLVELVWDPDQLITSGFRALLDDCCRLFPAFAWPLLQLLLPLSRGPAAAANAYTVLQQRVQLTALYAAGDSRLYRPLMGDEVVAGEVLLWELAPEVKGIAIPQGTTGRLLPLPLCCRPSGTADEDGQGGLTQDQPLLIQWDVTAEDGLGQVVLLARAAHCLRQNSGLSGAQLLSSPSWQDLGQVLQLLQQMLAGDPRLAQQLLAVRCLYSSEQYMDWLDVIVAALNLIAAQVSAAGPAGPAGGAAGGLGAARGIRNVTRPGSSSSSSDQLLSVAADCLKLAAALAQVQPHRVMLAVGGSALMQGVVQVEHMPRVAVEELHEIPQGQLAACLELQLPLLEMLQTHWEAPMGHYPVTQAVVILTSTLLSQHYVTGPMAALVMFCVTRVLGTLGWLPFASRAVRWQQAAAVLEVVRAALDAGAVAAPEVGPKEAGAPSGLKVTALAAACIHQLAYSGSGYFPAALPLSSTQMEALVERAAGSTAELAAAQAVVGQLLELVPQLLALCGHFPVVVPLQQYWLAEAVPNGPCPAALLVGYCTYRYSKHFNMLALRMLHNLISAAARAAAVGSQPAAATSAAAVGCVPTGWWTTLVAQVPRFREAVLGWFRYETVLALPQEFAVAAGLLEAAVRHCPELADQLCFPCSLDKGSVGASDAAGSGLPALPSSQGAAAASKDAGAPGSSAPVSRKGAKEGPWGALDGLWELLKAAGQLLKEQPQLVVAALRVLCVLWEAQEMSPRAVEVLRQQTGFWGALQSCVPKSEELSRGAPFHDACLMEEAAWRLATHASCLQLLLLELVTRGPDSAGAASSDSPRQLLSQVSGTALLELMAAGAALQLHLKVLQRFLDLLQGTCLHLCSSTVAGTFSSDVTTDLVTCAPELRAEVQPFWSRCTQENLGVDALEVACHLLVNEQAPVNFDSEVDLDQEVVAGQRVVEQLRQHPLGATLLSYAAVTPAAESFLGGKYGKQYLLNAGRLQALLGSPVCSGLSTIGGLLVLLEDVSLMASYCHGRLALQQSAAHLYGWLTRDTETKQQLMQGAVVLKATGLAVKIMDVCLSEHQLFKVSPTSHATALPWALPFFSYLSNTVLEVAGHQLLNVVRVQGAAASAAQLAGLRSPTAADLAVSSGGSKGAASSLQQLSETCTACARLFAAWLTSEHVNSMPLAEGAGSMEADGSAVALLRQEAVSEVDILECFATSLLQLLKLARSKAADAAAAAAGSSKQRDTQSSSSTTTTTNALQADMELQTALQQLLPLLCSLAARSSSAVSSATAAVAADAAVAARQQVQGTAAVVQLIITICQHHLPMGTWAPVVTHHLQLVLLLQHMVERVAARMASATASSSSSPEAGAVEAAHVAGAPAEAPQLQQAAGVLDASILELAAVVASSREAAARLVQQGLPGVLVRHAQVLLDASSGGLLGAAMQQADGSATAMEAADADLPTSLWLPGSMGTYCWPSKAAMQADMSVLAAAAASTAAAARGSRAALTAGKDAQQQQQQQRVATRSSWNPVHQQWCLWLSLASLLLQQVKGQTAAEEVAMDLFSAARQRLQLVLSGLQRLQPTALAAAAARAAAGGGGAGPDNALLAFLRADAAGSLGARGREPSQQLQLQLALLVEVERGLQLLTGVAEFSGAWQLVAPGSLAAFRVAVTGIVQWGALPSRSPPAVSCPPCSPLELRLLCTPAAAALPMAFAAPSWLQLLAGPTAVHGDRFKSTSGQDKSSAAAPPHSSMPSSSAAGDGDNSAARALSEYGLRLVEAVYTVLYQALALSLLTSPQVEERELLLARNSSGSAGGNGSATTTWPDKRLLEDVQRQALDLARQLLAPVEDAPPSQPTLHRRQLQLAGLCSQIARLCAPLINAWGDSTRPAAPTSSTTGGGSSMTGYGGSWQQQDMAAGSASAEALQDVTRLLSLAKKRWG